MKHNRNIFIIIGVTALACGQLQGLSIRQLNELIQLKQELDLHYAQGIPEI